MSQYILTDRSELGELDKLKLLRSKFESMTADEQNMVYSLLENETNHDKIKVIESIVYKERPPTPQEFLDYRNGWLPKDYIDTLREWVIDSFYNVSSKNSSYQSICFYGATRLGKSHWAILQMLYTIVYLSHLRSVTGFYKLAPNTVLSLFILSFDYKKVHEVYLQPLYNMLETSERFTQVKFQDKVKEDQYKYGLEKIVWSKASLVGHLTLACNLKVVSGNSDVLSIIGSNILSAYISEIAFFIESAGASEDQIFRLYSDVSERIKATMGRKAYLSFTYLDSSANIADSMIEKHILKKLRYDNTCYFKWLKRWDVKELHESYFPTWKDTKETFPVYVGDSKSPAKIIYDKSELSLYSKDLIENVPIDAKPEFETNILKSIKDICGRPTVSEAKFIQDNSLIDRLFDVKLFNIESGLIADTESMPELLIFNQIADRLFKKNSRDDYVIARAKDEVRYIGLDLAKSSKGDICGITMGHYEWSNNKEEKIFILDFSFGVLPGETGINLQAVEQFIIDLIEIGNVGIKCCFVDSALSDALIQNLNRRYSRKNHKFVEHNSVDTSMNDYQGLLSAMFNNLIKSGKNIFLKNNLSCLERVRDKNGKEKIDHPTGITLNLYDGNWESSQCGKNAKDVSDSLCQAYSVARKYPADVSTAIWEDINAILSGDESMRENVVKTAVNLLNRF